jgi:hypothetical protein
MCRDREFPVMLDSSVLIEHFAAATAALFSRAAGRRRYGREPGKWQPGRMVAHGDVFGHSPGLSDRP